MIHVLLAACLFTPLYLPYVYKRAGKQPMVAIVLALLTVELAVIIAAPLTLAQLGAASGATAVCLLSCIACAALEEAPPRH